MSQVLLRTFWRTRTHRLLSGGNGLRLRTALINRHSSTIEANYSFDFVVVGGGSAGCVLANRLSEDPNVSVCLIEAGPSHLGNTHAPFIALPVGYYKTASSKALDWNFATEPMQSLNGRSIDFPRGKVLGGCSSINGLIFLRGRNDDFDRWKQLSGSQLWGAENVREFYDKVEKGRRHQHGGERTTANGDENEAESGIDWSQARYTSNICDAFVAAARQCCTGTSPQTAVDSIGPDDADRATLQLDDLHLDLHADYSWPKGSAGYVPVSVSSSTGWRCGSASGYFHSEVRKRPNLKFMLESTVERLCWKPNNENTLDTGRTVTCGGVIARDGRGIRMNIKANREVVLAAGAIGSPHLLQVSGVGDEEVLRSKGVHPVSECSFQR